MKEWHNTTLRTLRMTQTYRERQHQTSISLIGLKFGKLLVEEVLPCVIRPSGRRVPMLRCRCDCGNLTEVCRHELTSGKVKSCGCLRGKSGKHHQTGTRLHRIWILMRQGTRGERNNRQRAALG